MMRYLKHAYVALCLLLIGGGFTWPAYAGDDDEPDEQHTPYTAASVRSTLLYHGMMASDASDNEAAASTRSIPLAMGLSAAVPGLGQVYNRQWIKAAVGIAVEAALITGYVVWNNKGNDGRDAYQAYAHEYWSPARYADWLSDYVTYVNTELGGSVQAEIAIPEGIDYANPEGWSAQQRQAVQDLIDQVNEVEDQVYHPNGATFSHNLPDFGDQQYYELVGKYYQFAPGWSDYAAWKDEDGTFTPAIDPTEDSTSDHPPNVSDRFFEYADDHGQANDYLRRASRMTAFFIVNHVIAAVDAAVFAKLHNDRLETQVRMRYDAAGNPEPEMSIRLRF